MNFNAYIQRQINLIRNRRVDEKILPENEEVLPLNGREKLLNELDNLKGLNKCERLSRGALQKAEARL